MRPVVFDLGGVLIDWDPRRLYRKLLPDDAAIEAFLTEVCTSEWNYRQDAGRTIAEAVAELTGRHPDKTQLIAAYYVPLYALTNWSRETFPIARRRFPFLSRFRGVVVSGEERAAKPDPRIYRILLERYRLDPAATLFIDDVAHNVEGARAAGMEGILFTSAADLRRQLAARSVPVQAVTRR